MPTYLDSSSTYADAKAAYQDNASYDLQGDTDMCRMFIDACRHLVLLMDTRSRSGDSESEFDASQLRKEIDEAKSWLAANDATATTSQAAGRVVFRDFGNFR